MKKVLSAIVMALVVISTPNSNAATIAIEPLAILTVPANTDGETTQVNFVVTISAEDADLFVHDIVVDAQLVALIYQMSFIDSTADKIIHLYQVSDGKTEMFSVRLNVMTYEDDWVTFDLKSVSYSFNSPTAPIQTITYSNVMSEEVFVQGGTIPEPSTTLLLLPAFLSLAVCRRR